MYKMWLLMQSFTCTHCILNFPSLPVLITFCANQNNQLLSRLALASQLGIVLVEFSDYLDVEGFNSSLQLESGTRVTLKDFCVQ